jgi:hypothetical protein
VKKLLGRKPQTVESERIPACCATLVDNIAEPNFREQRCVESSEPRCENISRDRSTLAVSLEYTLHSPKAEGASIPDPGCIVASASPLLLCESLVDSNVGEQINGLVPSASSDVGLPGRAARAVPSTDVLDLSLACVSAKGADII